MTLIVTEGASIAKHGATEVNWIEDIGPAEALTALGCSPDERLVIKWWVEPMTHTPRREEGVKLLQTMHGSIRDGLVPVIGMGHFEDDDSPKATEPSFKAFEIMPYAGKDLKAFLDGGHGYFGAKRGLEVMLPGARALLAIHSYRDPGSLYPSELAHRDIKPSNLFVLDSSDEPNYKLAASDSQQSSWTPVVKIGDFGHLYVHTHSDAVTQTSYFGRSDFWTPPEAYALASYEDDDDDIKLGQQAAPAVEDPQGRDTWSFAATLFFAMTAEHPWQEIENIRRKPPIGFNWAKFIATHEEPDSTAFYLLDERLADAIRKCLRPHGTRYPLEELVKVMEEVIANPQAPSPPEEPSVLQSVDDGDSGFETSSVTPSRIPSEMADQLAPGPKLFPRPAQRPGRNKNNGLERAAMLASIVGLLVIALVVPYARIPEYRKWVADVVDLWQHPRDLLSTPNATPTASELSIPTPTASQETTQAALATTVPVHIPDGYQDLGNGIAVEGSQPLGCLSGDTTCTIATFISVDPKGCPLGAEALATWLTDDNAAIFDVAAVRIPTLTTSVPVTIYVGAKRALPIGSKTGNLRLTNASCRTTPG